MVHEAKYDYRSRALELDVEFRFPATKHVEVICWYNIYEDRSLARVKSKHGFVIWKGYVASGRERIARIVSGTEINAGITIRYGKMVDVWFYEEGCIDIPPDGIKGLSDYYSWRASCLSKAKWKTELVIYSPGSMGYFQGGFIAIYDVIADPERESVKVVLESDGSTRYYDICSIWFGSSGWMKWSAGLGRQEVTMYWSGKYWSDLEKYGLYVFGRDYEGYISCRITIPLNEMLIIALKIKSYSWPESATLGAETSFTITVVAPYSDVPNAFCGFVNRADNPGPIEVHVPGTGWVSVPVGERFVVALGTIAKGVDYTYGPISLRFKAIGSYVVDLVAGAMH